MPKDSLAKHHMPYACAASAIIKRSYYGILATPLNRFISLRAIREKLRSAHREFTKVVTGKYRNEVKVSGYESMSQ